MQSKQETHPDEANPGLVLRESTDRQMAAEPAFRDEWPVALAESARRDVIDESPRIAEMNARVLATDSSARMFAAYQKMASFNAQRGIPSASQSALTDERSPGSVAQQQIISAPVHSEFPQPAQFKAATYASRIEKRVASSAEPHLPDEAWHVVGQTQGKRKPGPQLKAAQSSEKPLKPASGGTKSLQLKLDETEQSKFNKWRNDNLPTIKNENFALLCNEHTKASQAIMALKKLAIKAEQDAVTRGHLAGGDEQKNQSDSSEPSQPPGPSSVSIASRTLVAELVKAYPIASHHYILLGNSPALLENAVKEAGQQHYSHLPLGGLTNPEAIKETFGKELADNNMRDE